MLVVIQATRAANFKCEKDGFFVDTQECWMYHICAGTTHSVKTCKDDLVFNPLKNDCDWAINVGRSRSIRARRSLLTVLGQLHAANGALPSADRFDGSCEEAGRGRHVR